MVKKKATRRPMKKAKKAKPARRKVKRAKKARPSKAKKKPVLGKKALTKGQLIRYIASDLSNLTKGDVSAVMDGFINAIDAHLAKNGPQEFTIPGVLKLRVVKKPPVKAREGINPFTGQPMMIPARPARNVVKARILKRLKELVR